MIPHPSIEVFKLTQTPSKDITLTSYVAGISEEIKFNNNRKAILICPGGGYAHCSHIEAEPIAISFLATGYNAFVLDYSVKNAQQEGKKFPGQLIEAALAMKFIKDNAEKFHIDPNYVFVTGYSAGGHLAASLGILYNSEYVTSAIDMPENYARPTGMILAYPVISAGKYAHRGSFNNILQDEKDDEKARDRVSLEKLVDENTVPAFIWHTREDKAVPVENSLMLASSLAANKIPFEMHIYPYGGHGASLANSIVNANNPTIAQWFGEAVRWMGTINAESKEE